jgi:hypothetical protein
VNAQLWGEVDKARQHVNEVERRRLALRARRAALETALAELTPDNATPGEYLAAFAERELCANACEQAELAVHQAKLAVTLAADVARCAGG